MARTKAALVELVILKPLWLGFLILAIVYFLQGAWVVGVTFCVALLALGLAGQALHPKRTLEQLAKEPLTAEQQGNSPKDINWPESRSIGKVLLITSAVVGVCASVLAAHYGLAWYFYLPLGLLIAWIGFILLGLILVVATKLTK
jgi:hypothetical protein